MFVSNFQEIIDIIERTAEDKEVTCNIIEFTKLTSCVVLIFQFISLELLYFRF